MHFMDYSSKLLTAVLCGPDKYSLQVRCNLLNYHTVTLRKEQILPTFMYVLAFTSLTTPSVKCNVHKTKASDIICNKLEKKCLLKK